MKLNKKLFIFVLMLLFAFSSYAYEAGRKYPLSFFHVNDTHGNFYKDQNGVGGWAILSTMVNEARKNAQLLNGDVFLTSGGDVNSGVPESDLLRAAPDFKAMSAMKFTAMVLGNHEFDFPWSHLQVQQSWANFPFLSANIKPNSKYPFPVRPYLIKNVHGLKVVFIGLTTEELPYSAMPANTEGLKVLSAITTVKRLLPEIKAYADVVVVLSHLGLEEDRRLAREVSGIDIILGGHSHSDMTEAELQNKTIIFQAFEKNKKVAKIDVQFFNGKLTLKKSEVLPIIGVEDPAILDILDPLKKESEEKLKVVIAETAVFLDGERVNVRSGETNLGNLLGLAIKQRTAADVVLINSGGIRSSIPVGPITYGDLIRVHPFGNIICTVVLKGSELIKYFETIATMLPGEGNFPQMAGVFLKTDRDNKILDLKINGASVVLDKDYKLAINNFMAQGGDRYPKVSDKPTFVDTGLTMEYMFRSYVQEKKVIDDSLISVKNYYQRQVE